LEKRLPLRIAALGAVVALVVSVTVGVAPYRRRYPGYAVVNDSELGVAWTWLYGHVAGAGIAYTGSNLPFPLYGRRLRNHVSYANVALGPHTKVHEFSGSTLPTSAEPAPYRQGARYGVWLSNLRALKSQVLFVTTLFPIVRRNIECDQDGFPIERAWADAHPQVFRLVYASGHVRIYAVEPAKNAGPAIRGASLSTQPPMLQKS
jgi:hypothetical protein